MTYFEGVTTAIAVVALIVSAVAMMKRVSPGSGWIQRTRALVESQPPAQWVAMGFPVGWQALPIWQ